MKVNVGLGLNIELTEIFNPVILRSEKEKVSVCFRDGVIELSLWVEDK